MNREAWLTQYAAMLRPWFRKRGYMIPGNIAFSMSEMSRRAIGCSAWLNIWSRQNNARAKSVCRANLSA